MATYQDLINEVRVLVSDEDNDPEYRVSDAKLVAMLNRGLRDMSRIRPDAFYGLYDANSLKVPVVIATGTPATGTTEVELTDTFQFEDQFWTPLVLYVVGSIELIDDEYTVDQRAIAVLNQFRSILLGV